MASEAAKSEWVTVPREVAEKHPLYGIGGWMILVILRCASIPVTLGPALIPLYVSVGHVDQSEPLFAYILLEFALCAALVAWAAANLLLIFARHRLFPKSYIGYLVLLAIFVLVETHASYTLQPTVEPAGPEAIMSVARAVGALLGSAVWIAYAIVSQRVNVTFLRRVRASDPALRTTIAETF